VEPGTGEIERGDRPGGQAPKEAAYATAINWLG